MDTVGAGRTIAQPVLNTVLIYDHGSLHGRGLSREPVAYALEIPAARVSRGWLYYDPPIRS